MHIMADLDHSRRAGRAQSAAALAAAAKDRAADCRAGQRAIAENERGRFSRSTLHVAADVHRPHAECGEYLAIVDVRRTVVAAAAADDRTADGERAQFPTRHDFCRPIAAPAAHVVADFHQPDVADGEDLPGVDDAAERHRVLIARAADDRSANRDARDLAKRIDLSRFLLIAGDEVTTDRHRADFPGRNQAVATDRIAEDRAANRDSL